MNEQIELYNDTVDDIYCIYEMHNLNDLLSTLGYDVNDITDIYNLEEIDEANFDENDSYVWLSKENGYIYSGDLNCALAVAAIDSDDSQELEPNVTLYRLEADIDGKSLGFAAAMEELLDSGDLSEDDKEVQTLNALLSNMGTPSILSLANNKQCWFTEAGISHFSNLISEVKNLFKSLNIPIHERTMTLTDLSKATVVDKYQVLAKQKRLCKMKQYNKATN